VNGAPPLADALQVAAAAWQRFRGGQSLEPALAQALAAAPRPGAGNLAGAAKDIAYSAARRLALVEAVVARLARTPPAPDVAALLAVALGQLYAQRHAAYAVVDQAVAAAKVDAALRPAAGFVNALLRNALRVGDALTAELTAADPTVAYNVPPWWLARLQQAWPEHWAQILAVQREPPPLILRVNRRRSTLSDYLAQWSLSAADATPVGAAALWLHEAQPVQRIPGFADGQVSVQDAGAQLAAPWLEAEDGMRVLDACAAPGGKTAHLAELSALALDAVESDAERAARIEPNFARLGLHAHARVRVLVADAAQPARWGDAAGYDRILLDAPCTASGIVRRHPDIPWLRRPADVAQFATRQQTLLEALWPLLKPAGRLLYVVCSLFPQEGPQPVAAFLARQRDARLRPLPGGDECGLSLPPATTAAGPWSGGPPTAHDGFYFALLEKR
jgi:16S rRNA (cytosine967-C5)-methyltransferase